ncbi:glycoside hydrolase family 3 C-terminal domain-containing protein [Colwellia psychrerythraea]|uniref:Beta-D-glucoside glucohydrolase n=1 Tax=Colwellia psychrerythraea (strain 34H / ATCC BAA-681) TaxID=167879 RepID=Q482C1_COLP3|nr:glycoside hydrolase family 3 C-terminal domain-containing protein [Colwellia psychrerythraea]AAZ27098.1 glycosyl hydrolase, family 3 [Colwellia psychrerythraea 34H]
MNYSKLKSIPIYFSLLAISVSNVGCVQQDVEANLTSKTLSENLDSKALRHKNKEQDIESLLAQLTLEEKISLVHANTKFANAAVERLGIHSMEMSDGPHGVRRQISRDSWKPAGWDDDQATYLPPLTAVAASWDPQMATLHGNVLGSEARHRNKDVILGPGVNLARLPLYGRNFEYLGEDPFLAAKLVVPEIIAIQANDVAATVKHFALNTQELNRHGVDATPDERTLREVYLPAFEAAVKEGNTYAMMGSYNNVYGTNANQNKHLIMDILKGEWGYQGLLMTDWDVDINTYDAAMNGLDLEMGTRAKSYDDYFLAKPLLKMIQSGKVPVAVLDDKVRRILRVQLSIGMMDKQRFSGQRNTQEHRDFSRQIATQGVVLLKNESVASANHTNTVLPLDKNKVKNILVLGPNADKKHGSGGGSSQVKSLWEITPLQGLKDKLGDNVEIQFMRARSQSGVQPIAEDFVKTNNRGTGTPAWRLIEYKTKDRNKKAAHYGWLPESSYNSPLGDVIQHINLKADIMPLASGEHVLKLGGKGNVNLVINGKEVINTTLSGDKTYQHKLTLKQGKKYVFTLGYDGADNVVLGWNAPGSPFSTKDEYLAAAKNADAVIYYAGLSHADDRESKDRSNMVLPNNQDDIISDLIAVNSTTVVFVIGGSAVEMPWAEQANAIVWGWYGGMEAGHSYADILFGDVNPSGKMPITLPKKLTDTAPIVLNDYNEKTSTYPEGVFIGYRWFEQQNIEPLFPFGHGLSYTHFSFGDISLNKDVISAGETITASVKITNTGKVAGAEVVQLYLHDEESSVPRPVKELKGFEKVFLQPGESQTVMLTLTQRDLSFWDVNTKNWLAEQGQFSVHIGSSVNDIKTSTSFSYQ